VLHERKEAPYINRPQVRVRKNDVADGTSAIVRAHDLVESVLTFYGRVIVCYWGLRTGVVSAAARGPAEAGRAARRPPPLTHTLNEGRHPPAIQSRECAAEKHSARKSRPTASHTSQARTMGRNNDARDRSRQRRKTSGKVTNTSPGRTPSDRRIYSESPAREKAGRNENG